MSDIQPKYDEYGFSKEYYLFQDEQQRDVAWHQICQQVNAPNNLIAIHVEDGKYFERNMAETMSYGATRLVRMERDGHPAIMVYFYDGLPNPNLIIEILDSMPGAELSER